MLHAGGDGKTNVVVVIMNIMNTVREDIRVMRWGGRIVAGVVIGPRTDDMYTVSICTTDGENARRQGCIPK